MEQNKLHEVSVTGIIVKNGKFLITQRALNKRAFPGKWTVPGGRLELEDYISFPKDTSHHWYNVLEKVLKREVKEETGLEIKNIRYLTSMTFIKSSNTPVLIISLYADYSKGEVELDEESIDFKWVNIEEAKNYDLIEGIYEEFLMLDKILKGEKIEEWNKKIKPIETRKVGAGFGVMLLKNNRVLLGKRHDDAEKADSALRGEGTWTMPGGKFEYGEEFEEGGKREVKEETGIILKDVKVVCVNNDKNEFAHFITVGLISDDFEGEARVMEPDEITEWRWFDLDNLPTPLYFPSEKILNYYKKEIKKRENEE
jgi:8-oxo-dGTP diphosphatase